MSMYTKMAYMLSLAFRNVQKSTVQVDKCCHCHRSRHVTLYSSVGRAEDCSRKEMGRYP